MICPTQIICGDQITVESFFFILFIASICWWSTSRFDSLTFCCCEGVLNIFRSRSSLSPNHVKNKWKKKMYKNVAPTASTKETKSQYTHWIAFFYSGLLCAVCGVWAISSWKIQFIFKLKNFAAWIGIHSGACMFIPSFMVWNVR